MHFSLRLILCGAISLAPLGARAQDGAPTFITVTADAVERSDQLPNAPSPQDSTQATAQSPQQPSSPNSPKPQDDPPATNPGSSSSSSQPLVTPAGTEQSKQQKAQQQIKEEEQQRILGLVPNFNTSYHSDAVSLTSGQKMQLAFRSAVDPFTFAAAFLAAGYHEALDDDSGFGWGFEGYMKRSGAAYLDAFDGTMIGNGVLPSILHQDPRYFRLGHGSKTHRILYAMSTTVVCRHDNTGKWEPNYSNIGGNLIAGAISNLYYPGNSSWDQTIESGLTVTAEGTIGAVFDEFWPDISRKLFHKDPTHGLDAQAAAPARNAPPKQENQAQER
jgi:hypothetical protein